MPSKAPSWASTPSTARFYALARLRVARGEPLKPTQRTQLARVVRLSWQVQGTNAGPTGERRQDD